MRIWGIIKMKKSVKLIGACTLILCFFAFSLNSCSKEAEKNIDSKKNIAFITRMNYGYHWANVKLGADAAAREFDVNIDYAAPNDEEDIECQIKLVNEALDRDNGKKIDALILAASDYKALVEVTEKAYDRGIPVIIIDSEVDTDKIHSYIATDNFEAGQKAGKALVNIAGTDCKVAVISFVKGTRNAEQREEGLMSIINKYPNIEVISKEYCLSDVKLAYNLTKNIISNNSEVDAIVALNEVASEEAAQAINEMNLGGKVKIITFDSTLQEINFLEKDIIQATVIQNPFSMGYLGVKYAVEAMEGKQIEKRIYTDSKVIDKDNMYFPDNQKLLFPFTK
jgi:ribose transport system substrate-binding protein